jgi:hypothetical protein
MPVTPKQTRVLRDHFGDMAADEIVDLLNTVEASSVTELRALNELNFARFAAKMDSRFDAIDAKMDRRFAEFEAKLDAKFDSKLKLGFAEQDARMAERLLAHTRWMLGGWSTIFLAIIGLWFRK